MRTRAAMMFSQIAIPAEHLERRVVGKIPCLQVTVELITTAPSSFLSMLAAVSVDMINGQKPQVGFPATSAFTAVSIDRLFSELRAPFLAAFLILLPTRLAVDVQIVRNNRISASATHSHFVLFGPPAGRRLLLSLVALFAISQGEITWTRAA